MSPEMSKWAVAQMNFYDNILEIRIADNTKNWKDALEQAFPGLAEYLSDDIDEAKKQAFDDEWLFEVRRI